MRIRDFWEFSGFERVGRSVKREREREMEDGWNGSEESGQLGDWDGEIRTWFRWVELDEAFFHDFLADRRGMISALISTKSCDRIPPEIQVIFFSKISLRIEVSLML